MSPLTHRFALAGITALYLGTAAALTITPPTHDFGKVAVNGALPDATPFQFTDSAGNAASGLTLSVAGPDAGEFIMAGNRGPTSVANWCSGGRGRPCDIHVDFRPTSLGIKRATLVATDSRGNRSTAALRGEGVDAMCEMKVVFCNYAHLYSGVFSWTSAVNGPNSQEHEAVTVDVIRGVATCNGGATSSGNGRTRSGTITGPGLIAVELETDSLRRPVYRITVACPTPSWPATPDEPATPSEPAELGQNEQKSYDQPMAPTTRILVGSYSHPENDPINGVTGTITVGWELCSPTRYRIVPNKVCA